MTYERYQELSQEIKDTRVPKDKRILPQFKPETTTKENQPSTTSQAKSNLQTIVIAAVVVVAIILVIRFIKKH